MDVSHVIGAVTELFSWIGFGGAVLLALAAVISRAADGTWVRVRAFVLAEDGIVRWFGAAHAVGEAPLTAEIRAAAGGADELDLYASVSRPGRVRLHPRASLPPFLGWCALALALLGVASVVVQLVVAAA